MCPNAVAHNRASKIIRYARPLGSAIICHKESGSLVWYDRTCLLSPLVDCISAERDNGISSSWVVHMELLCPSLAPLNFRILSLSSGEGEDGRSSSSSPGSGSCSSVTEAPFVCIGARSQRPLLLQVRSSSPKHYLENQKNACQINSTING